MSILAKQILRYIWAFPTTFVGLLLIPVVLLTRGHLSLLNGVIEMHGGVVSRILRRFVPLPGGAAALTLGHVVLGRDPDSLERTRSHERIHVRQAEIWGPLFIPAYLLSSLVIWVKGGNPYLDNPFEKEAFAVGRLTSKERNRKIDTDNIKPA